MHVEKPNASNTKRGLSKTRRTAFAALILMLLATIFFGRSSAAPPSFSLPFAGEPGPSSWYVAQWYGSTVWAYRNYRDIYSQGQGIHFGIDFAAPCDTPVHAIGDGVVFAVDGPYGAAPHNVVIDHQDGLLSLYGHLMRRSNLRVGQRVARGDVIGVSGDPVTPACDQASHLHLEIRRSGMSEAVNPVPLIDADWRRLTIGAGTDGTQFELFVTAPGEWMTIEQQPDTRFGGPILNRRGAAWPPS
ncbi:MAG TPA: M23 family metallopeptidase [Nitrolancea sp.]|nr:M23 family metallopeptidase [Nitrolancea sp.]